MSSRLIRSGACRIWLIPKIVIDAPDYTHLSSWRTPPAILARRE